MTKDTAHGRENPTSKPRGRFPWWAWLGISLVALGGIIALVFRLGFSPFKPRAGTVRTASVDSMEQVYIPKGQFRMGSSSGDSLPDVKPQHAVYLDSYWIDRTEVTNDQFAAFVDETGYRTTAEKEGRAWVFENGNWTLKNGIHWRHPQGGRNSLEGLGDHPVVHVSWYDAQAYCQWAGRRLPTEAEWEKAAGGVEIVRYPWGNQTALGDRANFADQSLDVGWANQDTDDGYPQTAPGKSFPEGVSPYGAFNMAGNVYEWVEDWYLWNYYSLSPYRNPGGPDSGEHRSLRGGSWITNGENYHIPSRVSLPPDYTIQDTGFRCAESAQTENQ